MTVDHGLTKEARELHESALVFDLHVDSFLLTAMFGYDFAKRHRPPFPRAALLGHYDLPRMEEGGVDLAAFGVVANPFRKPFGAWRSAQFQMSGFHRTVQRSGGRLRLARTPDEALQAKAEGARAGFLGFEGAHLLGDDLANLERAYAEGVRYVTLTHFNSNKAASCAKGLRADARAGLSSWGFELLEEMNRLGVMVDLAHVNKPGFMDAARRSQRPCLVSHGGVRGVLDMWRNTDDEQLKALADGGGVLGVIFAHEFVHAGYTGALEGVFACIDYIVTHFGEDYVGLGSDFDGFIVPVPEIPDAAHFPVLTARMLQAGYSEERIRKILGENALRVWRANAGESAVSG